MARVNVSGRALAGVLGWTHTVLSRRLSGHVPFRVDELDRIARHLGIPVTRFYENAPEDGRPAATHAG